MSMVCAYRVGALLTIYTLHILIATPFSRAIIPKKTKLSLRLIHRDSISSCFHSSKEKISQKSFSVDDDIRAPAMAKEDHSIFLVNISMGSPPVSQLLAMDTGSGSTWVRCTYCERCTHNIFDPKKSSTYSELSMYSPQCHSYDPEENRCPFAIIYEDQSFVKGFEALEKFTFITSTGGTFQVHDAVFGCALSVTGRSSDLNGILGLEATNKYSIIARYGNKFSYCIGSIRDTQYMYNQLILGDGAIIQGDSTPMETDNDDHYVVSLQGISVGDKQLTINQHEFYNNVIIDSGSTYSQLKKSAYEQLVAEVKDIMNGKLEPSRYTYTGNPLCYKGNLERDLKGFPIVTLHLAEGADMYLDADGLFMKAPNSDLCMAVVESNVNLIGIVAQQYYNLGFDLVAQRLSLQRIDCELLED